MNKDLIFKELEECFYTPQVLKNIEVKRQLEIEEPKKALRLLKNNNFSLAKEKITNSHFSIIADISGVGFWHKRYYSQIKNIPGTIVLKNSTSEAFKGILQKNPDKAKKLTLAKIDRLLGRDSETYSVFKSQENINHFFWHQVLSDLERLIFLAKTRQPNILVSLGFKEKSRLEGVVDRPFFTEIGKTTPSLNKKKDINSSSILEVICKDLLINIIYYRESPSNAPWMEYITEVSDVSKGRGYPQLEEMLKKSRKANSNFLTNKRDVSDRHLKHKVNKIHRDFSLFHEIKMKDWKQVWNLPRARKEVLKSSHCNAFLDFLVDNLDIEIKSYLKEIDLSQKINSLKGFFAVVEHLDKNIKTDLLKEILVIDPKELYYTKNLDFFKTCIERGYYAETLETEENASFLNHLVLSEQWDKLEIMKSNKLFSRKIEDEDGHTPEMILDLVAKKKDSNKSQVNKFRSELSLLSRIKTS